MGENLNVSVDSFLAGLKPGDLVLVAYGVYGTQVARLRGFTRTGKLEVDRFLPPWKPTGRGRWRSSKTPLPRAKVLGPVPAGDARLAQINLLGWLP